MTIKELKEKLDGMPEYMKVYVFDWRKNLGDDIGDGSSEGVHEFDVEIMELAGEDEYEEYERRHDRKFVPWVALGFSNGDYDDEGKNIWE